MGNKGYPLPAPGRRKCPRRWPAVCGVLERLSHRHVSQNIVGGVQHNMPGGGGVRQAYGEPVTVHILADGISVQHVLAENQVDLLILQGHNACLVVGDDLDSDLLNCGRLTPIILIALKNSILIGNKVCEHIRTCPDIAVDAVHRAAVDHAVRGNHCERADASQLGEHGVVRLAHLNDKSIAVRAPKRSPAGSSSPARCAAPGFPESR